MSAEPAEYGESNFYGRDDPTESIWWDEVNGSNQIDEVDQVFKEAGVRPEYGGENYIPPSKAFDEEEIESLMEAVDEAYGAEFEEFVDEVKVSNVHPQQSKQLERIAENETYFPISFSESDGFPTI